MSLGMNAYYRFKELEETCEKLGFRMSHDPRGLFSDNAFRDLICLLPGHNEALPAYSRDATLFRGSLDECLTFLHGWRESLRYLDIIGVTRKGTVSKAEKKHVEQLEAERTLYALRNNRDPGDLRKRTRAAILEGKIEDDEVPF